jgi:hypothetical protein
MKKLFIRIRHGMLLLIVLMAGLEVCSANSPQQNQNNQSAKDRIEALRIAFISQQLNLTPEEAQKFWPVYNAYRSESESLQHNYTPPLTADQQLELEQRKLDLKKKYKVQFEGALGTAKLNELYNLEHKFQEKLKEIREQRMQQQRSNQGRPIR